MRQVTEESNSAVATVLFSAVVLLVGVDILADAGSGAGGFHIGTESTATLLAGLGAVLFFRRTLAERRIASAWKSQAEELLASVGNTIEAQFESWALTPAESEVGLLLLKGLSFKEVGAVRQTSERTAREQARAVYRKAGVAGRAEFSAWFIEDLLPPNP